MAGDFPREIPAMYTYIQEAFIRDLSSDAACYSSSACLIHIISLYGVQSIAIYRGRLREFLELCSYQLQEGVGDWEI